MFMTNCHQRFGSNFTRISLTNDIHTSEMKLSITTRDTLFKWHIHETTPPITLARGVRGSMNINEVLFLSKLLLLPFQKLSLFEKKNVRYHV